MAKKFYKESSWGGPEPHEEYTYGYLTDESSDEEIEEAIEKGRQEYYSAWYCYVSDFE